MKYLGTRSQQYDPVVTQDIENKENAISSTGLTTSIKDTDYLVMYENQSNKTLRILWSNIKSKIETLIREAFLSDDEIIQSLISANVLSAVTSGGAILTDENNNILMM